MSNGRFGIHGGQYIPETLMNAVIELEEAYRKYKDDSEFVKEFQNYLTNYVGRPSLLYYAERMTKDLGGFEPYGLAQAEQCAGAGASGKTHGEDEADCRDRRRAAWRGDGDDSGASWDGV